METDMKTAILSGLTGLAVILSAPLTFAQGMDPENTSEPDANSDFEFSANVTLTSDYAFRGVSQTLKDPAIQGGFDVGHSSGFFAGVWASNVDFSEGGIDDDEADLELDIYVGFGADLSDNFSADLTLVQYIYPGTANGVDLDYAELIGAIHYQDYLTASIGFSDDTFASGEQAVYYEMSGRYPLPYDIALTGAVGYYDLDRLFDESYTNWSLGLERSMGNFTGAINYVDTDGNGADLFGSTADGRIIVSLTIILG